MPNYYYPQFYPNGMPMMQQQNPMTAPQTPQNAPPASSNGITWVQGEAAAKSYPVAPGQSVLLMDSEEAVMYIKTTDQSGMPQPIRIFDYKERKTERQEPGIARSASAEYVSRSEFEKFREDVRRTIKGIADQKEPEGEG